MATGWNAQIGGGKYALQFETDRKDLFKTVEAACHNVMDRVEYERLKKEQDSSTWTQASLYVPDSDDLVLVLATGEAPNNQVLIEAHELARLRPEGWELERFPGWFGAKVSFWRELPEPPWKK